MASSPTTIEKVLEKEVETIHARRRAAGIEEYQSDADTPVSLDDTRDSLVGLALSGGGVRSGAFSLGIIQALYSAGRMRAIDFISTVSGGGYAGALFSAEVAKPNNEKINWLRRHDPWQTEQDIEPESPSANGQLTTSLTDRLEIEPNLDGSQPERIKELALYGRMMGDFVKLLSRHLAGFLITLTFLVSGVVACASLLAIVMRLPYNRSVLTHLDVLKFSTDLSVPMFPAFIAFVIWLVCLAIGRSARMLGNPVPSVVKYSYVLLMATTVLGVLAFLAIGDVDINSWTRRFNINMPIEVQERITAATGWIGTLLTGLFVTMLLPVLAPRKFLESGADTKNPYKKFVFNVSGWALIVGVPLFLYFLLVQENISGHTLERHDADRFTESHVVDIDNLLLRLQAQKQIGGSNEAIVEKFLATFVEDGQDNDPNLPIGEVEYQEDVKLFLKSIKKRNENEETTSFASAWAQAIASPVSSRYMDKVRDIREYDKFQQEMVDEFTDKCLSDPWLIRFSQQKEGLKQKKARDYWNLIAPPAWQWKNPNQEEVSAKSALRSLGIIAGTTEREKKQYKQVQTAYERLVDARKYVERYFEIDGYPHPISETKKSNSDSAKDIAKKQPSTWWKLCGFQDQLNEDSTVSAEEKNINDPFEGNLKNVVSKIRTSNWVLLNALYPEHVRPQNTTFAFAVNAPDQAARGKIAAWAIFIFIFTGLITNLNRTNLHGVYRDQLATTWLPEADIALADLDTCSKGAPLQLIHGTLNRMGTRSDPDAEQKSRFCMSYLFCGSNKIGYRPTRFYQDGELSVADAIAISGAAVSPIHSSGMLARVMLVVTNFRTGQWLLNPAELTNDEYWPSPLVSMVNWLRYPEQRKYLFVSDGGHLENTGMAALLERRCRLMILADASFDEDYKFIDVVMLLQDARAKYGIRVRKMFAGNTDQSADSTSDKDQPRAVSCFEPLRPNDEGFSKSHFVVIEIQYPDDERDNADGGPMTGLIILCKSSLTGDEVPELVELAPKECEFPHDPTSDQFLDPDRFESYLELGRHIGECVDKLVLAGGLDKYIDEFHLPTQLRGLLGWRSGKTQVEAPKRKTETRNESQEKAWKKYPFLRTLEQLDFNSKGIGKSLKHFEGLLIEYENQPGETPIDSSEFEAFSSWARERGVDAEKVLRKQLCDGLAGMIDGHLDTITGSQVTQLCFFQMLECLGTRVPGVSHSLKRLASQIN